MRFLIQFLYSVSLCLWLAGCQSVPKYQPGGNSLASLDHWQLKARVAINTPEESVSATLDWQKKAQDFDFHIYGMFGATYAHLIQQGQQATLLLPEEQEFHAQDANQLLQQNLGWDFPIDALAYWIKGLPSGKTGEVLSRDEKGQLNQVQFREWRVTFDRYQTFVGYQMPKIIKAVHPQLTLKVVVKDWSFLTPVN